MYNGLSLFISPTIWQQGMITFFSILGLVCKQDVEHNRTGLVMQQKKGLLSKHWTWFLQLLITLVCMFFGCVDDGWYTCFFWVHELSIVYKVVVTPLKLSLWLWPQNETHSILLATSVSKTPGWELCKKLKEKPLCSLGYHKLDWMSNAETKLKTTSICCHEFCAAHQPNDSKWQNCGQIYVQCKKSEQTFIKQQLPASAL